MSQESITERIENERKRINFERRTMIKDAIIIIIASAILATFLLVWKGQMTGFQTMETFESGGTVSGASPEGSLSFEKIPDFIAKVGEHIRFRVDPNNEDVLFRDDTGLFEIEQDGTVDFTPSEQDVGRHNAWIIIKDSTGRYYYQNVVIIVEE